METKHPFWETVMTQVISYIPFHAPWLCSVSLHRFILSPFLGPSLITQCVSWKFLSIIHHFPFFVRCSGEAGWGACLLRKHLCVLFLLLSQGEDGDQTSSLPASVIPQTFEASFAVKTPSPTSTLLFVCSWLQTAAVGPRADLQGCAVLNYTWFN